jgi:phage-related protein
MSMGTTPKPLFWMGSSKKDLKAFPDPVQDVCGFALWLAQTRQKHPDAKPLKGSKGAGVLEVVQDHLVPLQGKKLGLMISEPNKKQRESEGLYPQIKD